MVVLTATNLTEYLVTVITEVVKRTTKRMKKEKKKSKLSKNQQLMSSTRSMYFSNPSSTPSPLLASANICQTFANPFNKHSVFARGSVC
jgi:hypothetical protein